jgi:hypothetical protein
VQHPAQFSPEILTLFRWLIPSVARIHDPFAGAGSRLGSLARDRGWTFTGTEIEPAFIIDDRVVQGDATDPTSYPPRLLCPNCDGSASLPLGVTCRAHHPRGYTIVTSPVYPNGMADHFVSKAADVSTRRTYRHALAAMTGDRTVALHENNMGRWGYRGQPVSSTSRAMYWSLARKSVACWSDAEALVVNVSDSIDGDRRVPVVAGWQNLIAEAGWSNQDVHPVTTRRYRNGAGRDARVEAEAVIHAWR